MAQLQRYYPLADPDQWESVTAGQRAQLITPDRHRIGVIQQGTELVVSADGTVSGLLGASPGASTAVPIMIDLLRRCFPTKWQRSWNAVITDAVPALDVTRWDAETVTGSTEYTHQALQLRRFGTEVQFNQERR